MAGKRERIYLKATADGWSSDGNVPGGQSDAPSGAHKALAHEKLMKPSKPGGPPPKGPPQFQGPPPRRR